MTQVASNLPASRPNSALTKPAGSPRYQGEDEEDTMLPRIHVFQGLPSETEQYGKLNAGDLVNTLTMETLESRKFIPVFGFNQWIKWKEPRGSGMDYQTRNKSEVPPEDLEWDRVNTKPPKVTKYMNFVVIFEDEPTPVVLSFSRTSIKAGRTLNTLEKLRGKKGPGFYEVGIRQQQNSKGKWVSPQIKPLGDPTAEMAQQARDLYEGLNPETVKTNIDAPVDEEDFNPDDQ